MSHGTDQIGRMVEIGAEREPDRIAVEMLGGAKLTYRELDERSNRLAGSLLSSGLQYGDRVATVIENSVEYVEIYVAVAKAGLVIAPINTMFKIGEMQYQIGDSDPSAVVYGAAFVDTIRALAESGNFKLLVSLCGAELIGGAVDYESLIASGSPAPLEPPDEDSLFILAYTSGTTGRPKGAMLTQRSVKNTCRVSAQHYRMPLFSKAAYQANMSFVSTVTALIIAHLYVYGTVVMTGAVDPARFLDIIDQERCTFAYIPTPWIVPMTALARSHPEKWQHVKIFVHSASKGRGPHLAEFARVVGGRFFEGWGMSEISGALATGTDRDDIEHGSGANDLYESVGRPVIDAVVKAIDDQGNELPRDGVTVGELALKASSLMIGYWRNEEATAAALVDGWYMTGDLGSVDPAGYVYVSERRTDLIVSGGMNVYPSEVESTLAGCPGVQDVAVVAADHERWGQTPVAVIVRAEGSDLSEDDVIEYCKERLATYKKPTAVVFMDELPRTASNKVKRRVLRDLLAERTAAEA